MDSFIVMQEDVMVTDVVANLANGHLKEIEIRSHQYYAIFKI